MTTVHICRTEEGLLDELASDLAGDLRRALERGRDLVAALGGGAGLTPFLDRLACLEAGAVPWHHLQAVVVDECDVPASDPASTRGALERLRHSPFDLSADRLHAPPIAYGDLDSAARAYEAELHAVAGEPLRIDWMLLSLGADGHIGSLFPRHRALQVDDREVVGFADGPTRPKRRVTLTVPAIRRARAIHVVVLGRERANAVRLALDGPTHLRRHPAHALRAAEGRVDWWLDEAADCRDGGMPGYD